MTHTIQKPQFELNALEPYFDAATMDLHVNKHHQTYADKLNAALESQPDLQSKSLEELVSETQPTTPLPAYQTIKNMAGGVLNHNFFWSILSPEFDQPIPEVFQPLIPQFTDAATKLFGSGWTWLTLSQVEGLQIITTPNQDSPLAQGLTPLLTLDLWEHSYYLKYQNRRPEYIAAFWHIVNWRQIDSLYQSLITNH